MNLSEFLISCPLFSDFPSSELDLLEKAMMVRRYPSGYEFIKEGQRGDAMYLILQGEVSVTRLNKKTRSVERIQTMKPGDMFGLLSLIDHSKRSATCTAIGKITAASLPSSAFELLYQANAPIAHHFQWCMARQLARDLRAFDEALLQAIMGKRERAHDLLRSVSHEYRGPAGARRSDLNRAPGRSPGPPCTGDSGTPVK